MSYRDAIRPKSHRGVTCAECGSHVHMITFRHLRKHQLTTAQYAELYPKALFARSQWMFRPKEDQKASRKQMQAIEDREYLSKQRVASRLFRKEVLPGMWDNA